MERGTRNCFALPRLERVLSGAGCLASLDTELDRYGCARPVIVTGRTVGASPLVARITAQLGTRAVLVFDRVRQHVPSGDVQAAAAAARAHRADCLISVGGGSPIDAAKGIVHALMRESGGEPTVHIAVPTTLSAGEFTDVAGITDEATRVKHAVHDTRLAPRTVIADPEATLDTPGWLWAASGIRALDHAIETLYSPRRHAISEPLAARAIETLVEHLPNLSLASRGESQMAAWLAVFGVTNAGFGLSHVLGHQIGPRWHVAHGVTSAIVLPHAMRFMADAAPARFAPIAQALRVPYDPREAVVGARACADRVAAFIAQFHLPARLRDVSVPADGLDRIAGVVAGILGDADIIDRRITAADLAGILSAAY